MSDADWYGRELALRDKMHILLPPPRHIARWILPTVALLIALALGIA